MRIGVPAALAGALAVLAAGCGGQGPRAETPEAPMTITVSSTAFTDGGDIPRRHTCDGDDVSPPLRFAGVPSQAQELALLVEDPDAPGGTFVHWVAWGIDPSAAALAEGESPAGTGTNGFRRRGYGGPCPPKGAPHRYVFTVFALSGRLDLPPGASADDLRRAVMEAVIAEGRLVGRYART
jgi:Raf kinase inhibitor-like YbhB/YbcL family protein